MGSILCFDWEKDASFGEAMGTALGEYNSKRGNGNGKRKEKKSEKENEDYCRCLRKSEFGLLC